MSAARHRGMGPKSIALIAAAVGILSELQPTSVRSVCYQLFNRKLMPDMSRKSTGNVSRLLVKAREQGLIQWGWIVDETREAETIAQWDRPESIIRVAMRTYRKDRWQDQANRVEVWSEKGTVRGTLAPILREYGVTFRVMHGFGSATVLHDIAEEAAASAKPLRVLYVGDRDPSGMHMSDVDAPGRVARYGGEVTIDRIALTADDVAILNWANFPASDKRKDPRYAWFVRNYGDRCAELDALSPVDLRQRVEDAIRELLDLDAWGCSARVEAAERESMGTLLSSWQDVMQAGGAA